MYTLVGEIPRFVSAGPVQLQSLRGFKCADPRDHIYGLLGFYDCDRVADESHLALLDPDYTTSVEQVFTDATRFNPRRREL
jgi:hypothetical protein